MMGPAPDPGVDSGARPSAADADSLECLFQTGEYPLDRLGPRGVGDDGLPGFFLAACSDEERAAWWAALDVQLGRSR